MNRCEYNSKNTCPIESELARHNLAICEIDQSGHERCGPVGAYLLLDAGGEALDEYDRENPIVGKFEINQIPEGVPPLEIRKQWVGVALPIRHDFSDGLIRVSSMDVTLSLLSHGKFEAAQWFFNNKKTEADEILIEQFVLEDFDSHPFIPRWQFPITEGAVVRIEPANSWDWYWSRIDPALHEQLDREV